ncbi:eukaryotic cytochrome b561-domain-containing protein [Dipodascopsis uninucleata]
MQSTENQAPAFNGSPDEFEYGTINNRESPLLSDILRDSGNSNNGNVEKADYIYRHLTISAAKTRIQQSLFNSKGAIGAQVSSVAFFLYIMYHIIKAPTIFFTGHVIFNTFGILVLIQSVILLQPISTFKDKKIGGIVHGIFNSISVVFFMIALSVVVYNKAAHNGAHFISFHSRFGLFTFVLVIMNTFGGIAQFLVPAVYSLVIKKKSMYKVHRTLGYVCLVLLIVTVVTATVTPYNTSILRLNTYVVFTIGLGTILCLATGVRPSKFQFKVR